MPQTVSIPNFGEIDFPDEMSPDDIQKAVRSQVLDLSELPHADKTDLSKDEFLDRRYVANSNLSNSFQDLQRESDTFDQMAKGVQDGSATISTGDLDKASARVKFLQDRFSLAKTEAEQQAKDNSPWFESFKASFAQGGFYTKALASEPLDALGEMGVHDLQEGEAGLAGKPKDPARQDEYNALRSELTGLNARAGQVTPSAWRGEGSYVPFGPDKTPTPESVTADRKQALDEQIAKLQGDYKSGAYAAANGPLPPEALAAEAKKNFEGDMQTLDEMESGQNRLAEQRKDPVPQSTLDFVAKNRAQMKADFASGKYLEDATASRAKSDAELDQRFEGDVAKLRQESELTDPAKVLSRKSMVLRKLQDLEYPMADTYAEKFRQSGLHAFEDFGASEFSPNAGAQFGRATGQLLPGVALSAAGLGPAVLQMAGNTYEATYAAKKEEYLSQGKDSVEADMLAQKDASDKTVSETPKLGLYLATGRLTSGVLARILPSSSPILRSIVGGAGAAGSNVGVSALLGHYTDGHRIEQLTQDLGWSVVHGQGEFKSAREALDIINGTGTSRGGQEIQRLMNMSVDNTRSQIADALEKEGGAENLQKAKALRFQESEDQRMALKQVEQMRSNAARALGKAGKPLLSAMADAKFRMPADGETAPDPYTLAMQESAPKVGPATTEAVKDLTAEPAKPKPAVMATPTPAPKKEEPPAPIIGAPPVASTPPASTTPEPVPAAAPVEPAAPAAEPATKSNADGLDPVQVPVAGIKISKDVPQFKADADPVTGETEPLKGPFDKRDFGQIQLWERNNGDLEVISGRHRFAHAQRTGQETVPAQIHREADGFTAQHAAMLDAELNIRDGQGSVSDYANYFRNSGITQADAETRGLLARAKGKTGFQIGTGASEDVFALHQSGKLSDAKTTAIVAAAPGDANLQRLAVKYVNEHPGAGAGEIGHFLNATAAFQKLGHFAVDDQGDLFGTSDASINAADKAAAVAKDLEGKAKEEVRILSTALNRAGQLKLTDAEAKRFGVSRDDAPGIKRALDAAKGRAEGWDNWHMDEGKRAAVFALAGVTAPAAKETGQGEAPARAATPADDLFAGRQDSPFNLTAESAKEKAEREARERNEQIAKETAQRERDKAEAEKNQGSLPMETPAAPSVEAPKSNVEPGKPAKKAAAPAKTEKPLAQAPKERVRLGKSPQTYTVEEKLAPQKGDLPGEHYFRVKNERTGEEQVVEAKDLRPVGKKGEQSLKIEADAEKTLAKVDNPPEVQLFDNEGEIPDELGGQADNVRQARNDGNIVEGWHAVLPDGRRVIVLNKNAIATVAADMGISVEERAHQVTLHELGHDRQHLGALLPTPERRAYNSVVEGVISRDSATAEEIAKLYGYDLGSVTGRAKTAEEMLVREGEQEKPAAWYHRAIAALVDIFRGLGYKGKLTESELRVMLDYANKGRIDARKKAAGGEVSLAQQRSQVGGVPDVGHLYSPRDLAATKGEIRANVFDSTQPVSPGHTAKAWDLIENLTDLASGRAYHAAGDITAAASGSDIAVPMVQVELMNYAARLAGHGDPAMMNHLLGTVNLMPTSATGAGTGQNAAALTARKTLESGLWTAVMKGEQAADAETARMLAGRDPTASDLDFIRQLKKEILGVKGAPIEPGEEIFGPKGEDLGQVLGDKLKSAGVQLDNPMLQALVQIAKRGYEDGTKFTFTASNEPVATASEERRAAVGKLIKQSNSDKIPGQMVNSGASGLEHAFWRQIDAPAEEGLLSQLDKAQNQQLANVVKDVLSRMGIEPPKGNKLTDAEKVATMLNERPLDNAKRQIADDKIRAEIEQRRQADLKNADDAGERQGISAYYDNLRDAWDVANKRATDMPVSDSLLRRLLNAELKAKDNPAGVDFTAAEKNTDPREVAAAKKTAVDGTLAKVNAASWPGRDYSTLRAWMESTWDRMYAARRAKWEASQAREAARRAAGIAPDDAASFIIQSLARSQSDTPSFPTPKVESDVRRIVRQALQEFGPENAPDAWLADMKGKLMTAGVSDPVAESLAKRVQREREIRASNRTMKTYELAAENGSLAPIVDAINNTPIRNRTGAWIEKTISDYLTKAGIDETQARQAAMTFAPAIKARMEEAQVKAFEKSVKSSDLYKQANKRAPAKAKTDIDRLVAAVRSQAADPTATFTSKLAAMNGWKRFSPEQYKELADLDAVRSDDQQLPYKRAQATARMADIAKEAGAPPEAMRVLNEFYTAQALSGVPTDTINVASPAVFLVRDAITDAVTSIWKGPQHLANTWHALSAALNGYVGEMGFSLANDSYSHHSSEFFEHLSTLKGRVEKGIARLQSPKGVVDAAGGVKDVVLGIADYVRRALSTLDQGAISTLEQYNLSRYAMDELRRRGMEGAEIGNTLTGVIDAKSRFYADARAKGMSYAEAKTAANDFARDAWIKAMNAQGVNGEDVGLAAINDALRAVGKVGTDANGNKVRDTGMISSPVMHLIDAISAVAKDNPKMGLVYKMLFGFYATAARTIHGAAWYSPYGFVRLAREASKLKAGKPQSYAQTLATDTQWRARLRDSIAGTLAIAMLTPLLTNSSDKKKGLRVVVTGQGPDNSDPMVRDAWLKAHQPNAVEIWMGDKKVSANLGRAGEALQPTLLLAGALDDVALSKKHATDPNSINSAGLAASSMFFQMLNRGPYSMFTRAGRMFPDKSNPDLAAKLAGEAAYSLKPMAPLLGSTLAKNISDMFTGPLDKSSIPAAFTANIPFVGPAVNEPALNRLGDPIGDQGFDAKLWRLGIPATVKLRDDSQDALAYDLIRRKAQAPPALSRRVVEQSYGQALTDHQWRQFVQVQGHELKELMIDNYDALLDLDPAAFNSQMTKWAERAEKGAAAELGLQKATKE